MDQVNRYQPHVKLGEKKANTLVLLGEDGILNNGLGYQVAENGMDGIILVGRPRTTAIPEIRREIGKEHLFLLVMKAIEKSRVTALAFHNDIIEFPVE